MHQNKENLRLWVGRAALLGDTVSAIPIARFFKKKYPNSHLIWPIAKKCGQAAMLYINCPHIDEVYICDGQEGIESQRDVDKMNSCQIIKNINPPHPDNRYPNEFNIYSESWRMIGLPIEEWDKLSPEEQRPELVKWWNPAPRPFGPQKTIFIFGQAGYGIENKRNVSKRYMEKLVLKLVQMGYFVVQGGSERDWVWFDGWDINEGFEVNNSNYKRVNELSFFQQIQIALECDLVLGNDSGSSLIMGAYKMPMVSLIPIHWGNENNPSGLSTNNPNNHSFYSIGGTDNISQESVIEKIKEKLA